MAIKTYGVHDQWPDLSTINNVEIQSTDGVIDSVKINGEEQGGGGGSSDFSTATVTLRLGATTMQDDLAVLYNSLHDDDGIWVIKEEMLAPPTTLNTKTVVLYQGKTYLFDNMSMNAIESVEGNIVYDDDNACYVITGDCTVILAGTGVQ